MRRDDVRAAMRQLARRRLPRAEVGSDSWAISASIRPGSLHLLLGGGRTSVGDLLPLGLHLLSRTSWNRKSPILDATAARAGLVGRLAARSLAR